jgi:hypothetical protein
VTYRCHFQAILSYLAFTRFAKSHAAAGLCSMAYDTTGLRVWGMLMQGRCACEQRLPTQAGVRTHRAVDAHVQRCGLTR